MNQRIESASGGLLKLALLALLAGALLVACNHEPHVAELEYPGTEGGAIYFLTQSDGANSDNAALIGELRLVDGCLQIGAPPPRGTVQTIVWPEGFEIAVDDDTVLILNADRRVVTRVGEHTMLGGSSPSNDDRHGGCEGSFWYAGPTVRSGDDVPAQYR